MDKEILERKFEQSKYKDLLVWQKSLNFADQIINLIDQIESSRKHYRLFEQLESAVTSIPMNIAEGKGRNSKKEFMQFLYYARGSLYETTTLLEIFKLRGWITTEQFNELELQSIEIARMLNGFIRTIARG
jgi:four helix bundle protein